MKSVNDENKSIVMTRLRDMHQEFSSLRSSLSKSLADSLAGADQDMRHFMESTPRDETARDSIADRLRIRAAEFEADHPRMSELLRDVAELIRGMGI